MSSETVKQIARKAPPLGSRETWTAEPKSKKDWTGVQAKSRVGIWEVLDHCRDLTLDGKDAATGSNEGYSYARCRCGTVIYVPSDDLKFHADCGCGTATDKFQVKREIKQPAGKESPGIGLLKQVTFGNRGGVMGRPRIHRVQTQTVSMSLPVDLWEWWGDHCHELRKSKSSLVTEVLQEYKQIMEALAAGGKQ